MAGCATTEPMAAYKNKSDEQIFESGERNLAKGKYDAAVKDFEALDTLYPFGEYTQQAQLDIIFAYYKNDDSASALAAADRYIRLYPRGPNVDYAYYLKGLVNFGRSENWYQKLFPTDISDRDLNYMEESFDDFNALVQRFPESPYAPDARKRMLYIRNILARHELKVAKFYYERKAYVAAANRGHYIVEHYQGAPEVIPALEIMIKSYRELGETNMANETAELLQRNYPDSPEAKSLAKSEK